MMFLNYPNNPTAAVASEDFFEETVEVAKKHNVFVVHDFAYGAMGFDGVKQPSFLSTPGAKDIGIELYTMSKTFNMAEIGRASCRERGYRGLWEVLCLVEQVKCIA